MSSTTVVSPSSDSWFEMKVVFDKNSLTKLSVGGQGIYSDEIKHFETSWRLNLRVEFRDLKEHCSFYLLPTNNVKCFISIKLVHPKDDKRSINGGPTSHNFKAGEGRGWIFTTYQQLIDPIHGFLLNGALSVIVRVKVITELKYSDVQYTVANDMKTLLFDKATADCFILTSKDDITGTSRKRTFGSALDSSNILPDFTERIPVHKFILQLRSPVFKAMLSSAMKESTSNEIIISDFDHDVVKEFIRFLYLDTCDTSAFEAKSLLAMAHKYEVKGLLKVSENYLIKTLSIDTAVDLLQLSDLYEAKELKGNALKFIKSNSKILATAGQLEPLSPELMHDIIMVLADAK